MEIYLLFIILHTKKKKKKKKKKKMDYMLFMEIVLLKLNLLIPII